MKRNPKKSYQFLRNFRLNRCENVIKCEKNHWEAPEMTLGTFLKINVFGKFSKYWTPIM